MIALAAINSAGGNLNALYPCSGYIVFSRFLDLFYLGDT